MVHIHYTNGPEILRETSHETEEMVMNDLKKITRTSEDLADLANCSVPEVEEITKLFYKGLKRCAFCGEVFNPKGTKRIVCQKKEHYLPCPDCGTLVKVTGSYAEFQKCGGRRCPTCRGKKIGKTRKDKTPEEKKAIMDRQQATLMKNHGVLYPQQSPEIQEKTKNTVRSVYGVDSVSQLKSAKDQKVQTSLDRYGVSHPMQHADVQAKKSVTMLDRYGVVNPQQSPEIREKTKSTNIERRGVENVMQDPEVLAKKLETERSNKS